MNHDTALSYCCQKKTQIPEIAYTFGVSEGYPFILLLINVLQICQHDCNRTSVSVISITHFSNVELSPAS
jgi:hypothetical protein